MIASKAVKMFKNKRTRVLFVAAEANDPFELILVTEFHFNQ